MNSTVHADESVRRLAEATAWRVRLTEDDVETSEQFEAWIADPLNEAAWEQVQRPWREVGEKATTPELISARAGALERAHRQGRRRWASGASGRIAAGLAAVVIASGGYGGWRWYEAQPQVYRTTLGERRVVPLSDGSKVSLDSRSVLKIRYTKDARKLELVSGQARFDVSRDVRRPFSVTARDQTVVATGTAFNVDLLGPKVMVTLIEGQVVVMKGPPRDGPADQAPRTAATAAPPPIVLKAGQQLVAAPAGAPQVTIVSLDRATAWEAGQLAFEDEPLGAVAERVSRYAERPLKVAPNVADMRISGVFKAGDVTTFIDVVSSYLPVEAQQGESGQITLQYKG